MTENNNNNNNKNWGENKQQTEQMMTKLCVCPNFDILWEKYVFYGESVTVINAEVDKLPFCPTQLQLRPCFVTANFYLINVNLRSKRS